MYQFPRCAEGFVIRRRSHERMRFYMADGCNLRGVLSRGEDTSMAGFSALGDFYFYHLHLRQLGFLLEKLFVEITIGSAATEVAGSYLPDDIAAVFQVIVAESAFAGIMRKTADLGAGVHCFHRIGA